MSDSMELVEVIVPHPPRNLDAAAQPCRDCEAGEPHMCPRLRSTVVLVAASPGCAADTGPSVQGTGPAEEGGGGGSS